MMAAPLEPVLSWWRGFQLTKFAVSCSQYKAAADKLSAPIRQFAESKTGKRDLARLSHWFEGFTAPSGRGDPRSGQVVSLRASATCSLLCPSSRPSPHHCLHHHDIGPVP